MFSLGSSEGERGGGTLGISAEVLITPISFWMILLGGLRGDGGGGHFTLFTRGDPLPLNYTDFEHFGSTDHLLYNQVNMHTKNAQIVSKSPPKHHMILADVLPNAGEELLGVYPIVPPTRIIYLFVKKSCIAYSPINRIYVFVFIYYIYT